MPFTTTIDKGRHLAIGRCHGVVLEAEIHQGIDLLFDCSKMAPKTDRLVVFEPDADLRKLEPDVLLRVQEHVLMHSSAPVPAFRSILVVPSPSHRVVADIYKAIWDSYRLPGVKFDVVESLSTAVMLLDTQTNEDTHVR